jgi:hypothetical protein
LEQQQRAKKAEKEAKAAEKKAAAAVKILCKGVENRDAHAFNAFINDQDEFCQYTSENHLALLQIDCFRQAERSW